LIPYHCIENNQQFTHTGGKNNLVSLALLFEAKSKCTYDRIEAAGGKRRHIKNSADIFSAAPDMRFSVRFSRRSIPWGQTCQSSDFLAVEATQFRQICQQHSAGLRTHARSALEDAVFVFEVIIRFDMLPDELVELVDLEVQGLDHFLDALFNLWVMYHKQTIGFLGSQVVELSASSDQFRQFSDLGLKVRFRCRINDLCEFCQHLCVNRVGFCPLSKAIGKISNLSRIDHDNRHTGVEQFGGEGAFVTAGSFENDKSNSMVLKCLTELMVTIGRVRQAGFDDVWTGGEVECVFCDIDTDIDRFRHGNLPYLQMRTHRACGSAAVQTAVRACPTVAARFPLCDGLEDLGTIELSSPVGVGSARCATLRLGLRFARLANTSFTYETIINHE